MEEETTKLITCNICKCKDVEQHPNDNKACVQCGTEYFLSIRPDLTVWTEGLDAKEKSEIIKQTMKAYFAKERQYRLESEAAQRSCQAAYEELRPGRFAFGI